MAILVTKKGPNPGKQFTLQQGCSVLGRQSDSTICLESRAVSRHHARIWWLDGGYFVEDLGSSNGTYINGKRIHNRMPLSERDDLQIGPYVFRLQPSLSPEVLPPDESSIVIRESVSVMSSNASLFGQDPAHKLQVVLEIAQHLARTLELEPLLGKLLDQLMLLFPQADNGVVLLCEGEHLMVRAQRTRGLKDPTSMTYSRTLVQKALDEGVGLLSEGEDAIPVSETMRGIGIRSFLCVPLICQDKRKLGVIQIDRRNLISRPGQEKVFKSEDLQLLTAIGLQVSVVLENAALHAEVLREERLRQELALAREIQQGFLPTEFPAPEETGFELFACVYPARQVSGDLYDFFQLDNGRWAFFVGDVAGKGMPAALFMIAVRTLTRHLASSASSPIETLRKLNTALAADNPQCTFVTVVHGIYDPQTGEIVISSGGHPIPILRRADGKTQEIILKPGRPLGFDGGDLRLTEARLTLQPNDTLILYTDGYTEARAPSSKTMFGVERLMEALSGPRTHLPLDACVEEVKTMVEQHTRAAELQDDLTLLFLRRAGPQSQVRRAKDTKNSEPSK